MRFSTLRSAVLCSIFFVLTVLSSFAQTFNPVTPAKGFNVFTKNNIIAKAGDTHGPVAMGGDLELNGSTIFTMNTSGTYPTGNLNDYYNYGMVINGKIIYTRGNSSQVNQGFLRLGNAAGSDIFYKDNNNNTTNLKITPGGFNSNPQITLQRTQPDGTATNASGIDFAAAFTQLNVNSSKVNSLSLSTCVSLINKITIPNTSNPHITLAENKLNLIELTGPQLNNLTSLGSVIFDNKPAATRVVVFNIQVAGNFTWNTPNLGGVDEANGAYMLWNFYNTSAITFAGGNSIYGTVLAPSADIIKSGANNNNGQILSKSAELAYGEVHYFPFVGSIPDCPSAGPVALSGIDLTGSLSGDNISLRWKNADESNTKNYEVQRSTDGINFNTVSTVVKNTVTGNNYSINDNVITAANANIYYRIKVNTNTGSYFYSAIINIKLKNDDAVSLWPVPVTNRLNINFRSAANSTANIQVSDNAGRVVFTKSVKVFKGNNQLSADEVNLLSKGNYFLKISLGNEPPVFKQFIKL